MHTVVATLECIAGAALVIATVLSVVRSTMLPRAVQSHVVSLSIRSVRNAFHLRARHLDTYESRDRIMAMLGPIGLLVILASWIVMALTGYTLLYLGVTRRSFTGSLQLSGSSVFTLGTTTDSHLVADVLTYTEAGIGLLTITLLITYLPAIYGAFTRRETGVSLLSVRAGSPPTAWTMLIRYKRIEAEAQFRLTELWRQWESWFTDVEESHTTFPILVFFRSPQLDRSWITAAGVVLDAASFWAAAVEHPLDPDAQLCIRAGFLALRRIADGLGIHYDADPQPGNAVSVTRPEWDAVMDEMAAAGMPLVKNRDAAWEAWTGWRVNYDTLVIDLARLVEAPITPWISDRSTVSAIARPGRAVRAINRTVVGRDRARNGR